MTQVPATVEERAAAFTRLYEARAYLAYNLALRITCERKTALAAAETAFLRQAEAGADDTTLLAAVVSAALGNATRKPKPDGVGEQELPMLRAVAALAAPERAALALVVMADVQTGDVGPLLDVSADNGVQLLGRAMSGFAQSAGLDVGAVYDTYVEWGWAEPPAELWERVYREFRRAIDRAAADAPTQVFAAGAAPAGRSGFLRPWRRRLLTIGTAAIAAAVVAVILASTQASSNGGPTQPTATVTPDTSQFDSSSVPETPPAASLPEASSQGKHQDPVAAMQAKKHKPLTPRELDQLRLKELEALRNYQKRETDKRLTQAQRNYAANKVSEFRALAQERAQVRRDAKRLASRERALERARARIEARRRKEARQKAEADQQSGQADQQQQATPQPKSRDDTKPSDGSSNEDKGGAPTSDQAEQTCVQDQDTGAYICPEG